MRKIKLGANPGFLEMWLICLKVWLVHFAEFLVFFLNIPWKLNNLVPLTKLFHFHRIFKKQGWWEGGVAVSLEPPATPLDPPLKIEQLHMMSLSCESDIIMLYCTSLYSETSGGIYKFGILR